MVSLFKSQRLLKEKQKVDECERRSDSVSAQLKRHDALCIKYCTSTQLSASIFKIEVGLFEHKDVHLGMTYVSHACTPVLYVVCINSTCSSAAFSNRDIHNHTQLPFLSPKELRWSHDCGDARRKKEINKSLMCYKVTRGHVGPGRLLGSARH